MKSEIFSPSFGTLCHMELVHSTYGLPTVCAPSQCPPVSDILLFITKAHFNFANGRLGLP
jgi:hypothetical protein